MQKVIDLINKEFKERKSLGGNWEAYEVEEFLEEIQTSLISKIKAINFIPCCTELNNCFKKGEVVIYQGVKMRITFIDNCQKIAHMYCVCDETDWKEVSLSKLTKII